MKRTELPQRDRDSICPRSRRTTFSTLLVFLLIAFNTALFGQTRQVSGTVTDEGTGDALAGVNVSIKGTSTGTITDLAGHYSLNASEASILVFSYIGYATQEVEAQDRVTIDIALSENVSELDELVVVAYGVMKKSDITGSIVSIREEDLTAIPVANALEVLQGKVAGMDLVRNSGQAGSGISFNIRGERSLQGGSSNNPLIIVDGIEYGSNLDIHPSEIQSIEVLKDASSTAIYGSRGANGVILVTTKRGNGQSRVSLNSYFGSNKAVDYPEFFLGQDYVDFAREAHATSGLWKSEDDDYKALIPYELFDGEHFLDWRDFLLHDGITESYELFISGGNEKTTFSMSDFYTHERGIILMDDFKRYGGKLNVDHKISEKATAGVSISFSYTDRSKRDNPLNMANKMVPVGIPYNEDGTINIYPLNDGSVISPLADEQPGVFQDDEKTRRVFYTTYLEYEFLKNLRFRSTFGADFTDVFEGVFADEYTIRNNGGQNSASNYNSNFMHLQLENTLTYNREIGDHNFQVLAGNSFINDKYVTSYSYGSNFPTNTFLYYNMFAAQSEIYNTSSFERSQMVSFFGRFHYNYKDRYIFQATMRGDGASTLAEGYKWASFPSASVAWRMSEEDFLSDVDFISDMKLRLSYGTSGKRSIDPYKTQGLFYQSVYTWGDETPANGYFPATISNDSLKWETTATTDLGLDIRLFKNRISLSFDVYKQHTYNLLLPRQLPEHTGFSTILENVGETENTGFEIALTTQNVRASSGFNWTTDLTLFSNRERIVKLSESFRDLSNLWFVGYSPSIFYSHEKIGIWQESEEELADSYNFRVGDIKLKDYNRDGVISDADKVVIGQVRPKWSGGLNNSFSFKGFDLNVFIFARMGQTIDFEGYHWDSYWYEGRASGVKVDYWTYDNPTNEFPRPDRGASKKVFNETLRYVDGSFIKIRDITFGYSIPSSLVNRAGISRFRIYTTLKNYFLLYNTIPGYDSERAGDLSYPMTKQWLFGINVDF